MAKHVGAKAAAAAKDEKKAKQDSQKNAQADTHGTKEEKEKEKVDKKSTDDPKCCYTCEMWLNGSKQMVDHKQGLKHQCNWRSLHGFRFL